MTKTQALRKAVDLWGKTGGVHKSACYHWPLGYAWQKVDGKNVKVEKQGPTFCASHGRTSGCPGGRPWYSVGRVMFGLFFEVKGEGDSWEEAFADVRRKDELEAESYRQLQAKVDAEQAAKAKKGKARR